MRKRDAARDDFFEGELRAALLSEDCAVCILARETERAVVSWLATTKIREDATIEALVHARGLCARHWAGVLTRRDGDLGRSGAQVVARIADAVAAEEPGGWAPAPAELCPVCASVDRRERMTLRMLLDMPPGHTSGIASRSAICRPHLTLAAELAPGAPGLRSLREEQRRHLRTLAERARAADQDASGRGAAVLHIIAILAGTGRTARRM